MHFNFAARWILLGEFSDEPNKDSFNEGRQLELFIELNHLNTLSLKDCVN